jgi:hypothetical protein
MMKMESTESYIDSSFGNTKRLVILFFVYAIILPFFSLILPGSEDPVTPSVTIISWFVILLMPMDLLLVYVIYLIFRRRTMSSDITGPAVLMFVAATAPSIYTVLFGVINSPLRYLAISLGLIFSLVGLFLALRFVSALKEQAVAPE